MGVNLAMGVAVLVFPAHHRFTAPCKAALYLKFESVQL